MYSYSHAVTSMHNNPWTFLFLCITEKEFGDAPKCSKSADKQGCVMLVRRGLTPGYSISARNQLNAARPQTMSSSSFARTNKSKKISDALQSIGAVGQTEPGADTRGRIWQHVAVSAEGGMCLWNAGKSVYRWDGCSIERAKKKKKRKALQFCQNAFKSMNRVPNNAATEKLWL